MSRNIEALVFLILLIGIPFLALVGYSAFVTYYIKANPSESPQVLVSESVPPYISDLEYYSENNSLIYSAVGLKTVFVYHIDDGVVTELDSPYTGADLDLAGDVLSMRSANYITFLDLKTGNATEYELDPSSYGIGHNDQLFWEASANTLRLRFLENSTMRVNTDCFCNPIELDVLSSGTVLVNNNGISLISFDTLDIRGTYIVPEHDNLEHFWIRNAMWLDSSSVIFSDNHSVFKWHDEKTERLWFTDDSSVAGLYHSNGQILVLTEDGMIHFVDEEDRPRAFLPLSKYGDVSNSNLILLQNNQLVLAQNDFVSFGGNKGNLVIYHATDLDNYSTYTNSMLDWIGTGVVIFSFFATLVSIVLIAKKLDKEK